MASSGHSAVERLRRMWRRWRGVAEAPPRPGPARSSLFHLRMETRHRETYARRAATLHQPVPEARDKTP